MNLSKNTLLPFVALVIASSIWGINNSVMKITLTTVPVFSLAFIRFAMASLIILPFVYKKLTISKRDLPKVIAAGFCAVTLNIAFFFWGIKLTTALNAGIIVSCSPIISLLFAHFFLKEKISRRFLLGALFGVLGIAFLVGRDVLAHGLSVYPLGDFFIIAATLAFVAYETISKKLTSNYSPFALSYCYFLVGALSFLPLAIWEWIHNPLWTNNLQTSSFIGIFYGIFLASISAYCLWGWGLSKLSESKVGFFFYLDPIVSTIAAVILLSEKITIPFVIGAILIFTGIFVAEGHIPYHHLHKEK